MSEVNGQPSPAGATTNPSAAGEPAKPATPAQPASSERVNSDTAAPDQSAAGIIQPPPTLPVKFDLPGVLSEDTEDREYIDDVPAEIERQKAADKAARAEAKEAKAGAEQKDGAQDGKTEEKKPAEGEQAPAKFKFADLEFEDQAKAEHVFRTLRGQYRGMQTRERLAAQRAQEQTVAALAWKAEADALRAEIDQRGQGGQGTAERGEQPADAEQALMESVDWELYQQLHDDHGPKVASAWLFKQMVKTVREDVHGALDQRLAPREAADASAQEIDAIKTAFTAAASYTNRDGSPAYPELQKDGPAAREIGYILAQLDLPAEIMASAKGIHLAVVTYRDRHKNDRPASAQPTTRPPAQDAGARARALQEAANAAARGVTPGSGAQPRTGQEDPTGEAGFLASIRNAGNYRANLGFSE